MDDVHFEIEDSEAIQLDGYGISMTYDGENWVLDATNLPAAYNNAEIISSGANSVYLVLDPESSGGDEEADLKISLDEYAMAGDTLTFDVNDPTELHVQDIENAVYEGDAYNNTTVAINDPGVMTTDAENLSIIWNPYTKTWAWSDPARANDAGTLVSDSAGLGTYTVNNAEAMTMVSEDVSVYYDGAAWVWNDELKADDINTIDASLIESDTTPDVTVTKSGSEGAALLAGDYTLTWDEVASTWSATTPVGTSSTVTTTNDGCVLDIWNADPTKPSTIEVAFDEAMTATAGQSLTFKITSTPPGEYAKATISTMTQDDFNIDFDGDSTDDLNITNTTGTPWTTLSFDVNPDAPPSAYGNATLSGDATYCSIDLDGSGNEDDKQDIVFTFKKELNSGTDTDPLTDRSVITFDIEGSTSWRTVTTDEAEDTGYFEFTADFLGGEFGATEMDISFNIGSKFNGNNWVNDSLSSTQYATSSSTTYQDADGYASGDLTGIGVESDGLVSGSYSNGQEIALFKVALADFNNVNGLENEGGNLYSATTESGAAITNKPGENGLGTLSSYSLEMSNVDISEEFVDMISLQTAYEANAKIITTVDEMMNTVIGMKR